MTELIHDVSPETLRDLLQELGFRAAIATDAEGAAFVQSATVGMAFDARLGNPGRDGGALDFRLVAAVRVEGGALDLAAVNRWNNARRFSRLHLDRDMLLLDMDVSVAGGVSPTHLAGQLEMWNRLVEALIDYLRGGLGGQSSAETRVEAAA